MILVIGGTGTLGTRLVQRLRAQGAAVRVMTRASARATAAGMCDTRSGTRAASA